MFYCGVLLSIIFVFCYDIAIIPLKLRFFLLFAYSARKNKLLFPNVSPRSTSHVKVRFEKRAFSKSPA